MTYLRRSNVTERKGRRASFAIAFLVIALFAIHFFFPKAYPALFYPVTSTFWRAESGVIGWAVNKVKLVQAKITLVKENKRLSDEVASRESSMLLLDTLRKENEDLKTALGRSGRGDSVLGVVLSRPPMSPYDTLVVDIGENDGVQVGNKVYTDGDTLIGDVVEAYANQSKVSLFSSPGRIVPVIVGGSNVETQATGRGAGNFVMMLPVEVGIEEGDTITLPQIRAHTFGVVEEIMVDSSDSLQTILFKIPVNIHGFRYVQIDKNSR